MSLKYQDNQIIIRQAVREDMVAIAQMLQELADFIQKPDGPKQSVKDLERDCFDLYPPSYLCKVAEVQEPKPHLVGYAVYYPTYSMFEGRSTMLENFYVRESERHRGVGRRLFNAVAKEAASSGTRLDFHVLEWNPARAFYAARGALNLTQLEQWCYYRLTGDALKATAEGN